METSISRRRFLQFGGLAALTIALPAGGIAGLSGCRSEAGDAVFRGERTVTDHAGRELTIPAPGALGRVYFTSPLAQVFVFSLAPQLMAGTAMTFTNQELAFLPAGTADLPNMGSLSGNGEIVKGAKTQVSYAKLKKSSPKLSVNTKTGKITVAKGAKRGTYKIRIKATTKKTANYQAATATIIVKLKVV